MFSRSKNPNVQSFKEIHDLKIFTKKPKANPLGNFFPQIFFWIFMVIFAVGAFKNIVVNIRKPRKLLCGDQCVSHSPVFSTFSAIFTVLRTTIVCSDVHEGTRMTSKQLWVVLLTCLIFFGLFIGAASLPERGVGCWSSENKHGGITYGREELLRLSNYKNSGPMNVPEEITKRIRKRGRRGGVRARWRRRGPRLPVPAVVSGNIRSLRNKIDELQGLAKWDCVYRESSLICLTETWLNKERDPDSDFVLDGFTLIRGDRTMQSGKVSGGGVCAYINNRWCTDVKINKMYCDENIEYLSLSLRPFYLPREFTKVYVTVVYIPPSADVKIAETILYDTVSKNENEKPDALNVITGDFNKCVFGKYIPHYKQYIDFPTRNNRTLDLFFCNVKGSYLARKLNPLGISDHDMCFLAPIYKQVLKRSKPVVKEIYQWNNDMNEKFLSCIECTDFDALFDSDASVDKNTDVLNSYLHFCMDMIIPKKIVKCFPNNKPWVTKELKELLSKKKYVYANNNRDELREVQRQIDDTINICKINYKKRVENMFKQDDSKGAWNGLRHITGFNKKSGNVVLDNPSVFCNDLNDFYGRFDVHDFHNERSILVDTLCNLNEQSPIITQEGVIKSLHSVKSGKSAGPDKIPGVLLKICKEPLAPILCKLFQQSIDSACIPKIWKTAEIIPIPKKFPPTCKNDYRPVALTSIIMKCFEKIVKNILCQQVKHATDPNQFAYTSNRCVDDASLCLIDYVLKFLDRPNTSSSKYFAKILFVDFSSAFNTIQPHIMMQTLMNMNVNANLVLWINEFLTCRPQYVKYLNTKSNSITLNTGAPQGCVLSPVLFILYTSNCRCHDTNSKLFKYADDTALVSLCVNDDSNFTNEVNRFITWCDQHYLQLNVKKTKEMVVDFSTSPRFQPSLHIKGEVVESVTEYKYLGTIIDNKFRFNQNVDALYKKLNSRMYFIRKLSKIRIDRTIMDLFYSAVMESVMSFSISCWFGNCSLEVKGKLTKIIRNCLKLGVTSSSAVLDLYKRSVSRRCQVILSDCSHPLNSSYQLLPSGRRFRTIGCRTSRYSSSFVPASIRLLNER